MKRIAALLALSALIAGALVSPASSAPKSRVIYGLEGEGRGLELSIAGQGVTLGLALARGDSSPSAIGVGAGQCSILGDQTDPDDLPCNESTTQKSSAPGEANATGETCAGPAIPAPLDLACSRSATTARCQSASLHEMSSHAAAARPIPNAHSIWEIVLHAAAWAGEVARDEARGFEAVAVVSDNCTRPGRGQEQARERACGRAGSQGPAAFVPGRPRAIRANAPALTTAGSAGLMRCPTRVSSAGSSVSIATIATATPSGSCVLCRGRGCTRYTAGSPGSCPGAPRARCHRRGVIARRCFCATRRDLAAGDPHHRAGRSRGCVAGDERRAAYFGR